MSFIWMNILAVVIALTSMTFELPKVDFFNSEISSLQSLPSWEANTRTQLSEKTFKKNHPIAQEFIPIVVLADSTEVIQNSHFYLPLYRLYRQKEYFLLI